MFLKKFGVVPVGVQRFKAIIYANSIFICSPFGPARRVDVRGVQFLVSLLPQSRVGFAIAFFRPTGRGAVGRQLATT